MYCERFEEWLANFNGEKTMIILYGPPGSGKTSCVYRTAKKYEYTVIEFNASDQRDAEFFDYLSGLVRNQCLFGKQLILLDEADAVEDKRKLKHIAEIARVPVVLTANKPVKVDSEKVDYIRFFEPDLREILRIAKEQGVKNFSALSRDYRSIQTAKEGGQGFVNKDLRQMCLTGEYDLKYGDLFYLLGVAKRLDRINRFLLLETIRVADCTKKINETFNALKLKFPLR